jgi:outer membrane lipoprotein-sorting protein
LLSAVALPAGAQDAQKILDCMRGNVPANLRVQKIELSYSDADAKTRSIRGRLYEMRDTSPTGKARVHMMLRVDAPDDLRGSAYLARQTDTPGLGGEELYVYLPAIKQVRRITGETADGAFFGTNFSYNDLRDLASSFEGSTAIVEPRSEAYARQSHVISFTPGGPVTETTRSARVWVDQKTCLPMKVDYYEGKKLRKQMTTPDFSLHKNPDGWYVSQIDMNDLREGTSSSLKIIGPDKATAVPAAYFDPQKFYLN